MARLQRAMPFKLNCSCMHQFRLMLVFILRMKAHSVAHFGLQCGSWVFISRGSTLRTFLAPHGNSNVKCVADGNKMVSRLFGLQYLHAYSHPKCSSGRAQITYSASTLYICVYTCYIRPLYTIYKRTLEHPVYVHNPSATKNPAPRFCLLAILMSALRITWTLEQPANSLMKRHRRFRLLCKQLLDSCGHFYNFLLRVQG